MPIALGLRPCCPYTAGARPTGGGRRLPGRPVEGTDNRMRVPRPGPADPAFDRLNARGVRGVLRIVLGMAAVPSLVSAVIHVLVREPLAASAFIGLIAAILLVLWLAVGLAPRHLLAPIAGVAGLVGIMSAVGSISFVPLLTSGYTVGFIGIAPIAVALVARWNLRWHGAWMAVGSGMVVALVLLGSGTAAMNEAAGTVVVAWLLGCVISTVTQQVLEGDRRAALAAARTAHARRARATQALRQLRAVESIGRLLSDQGPTADALNAAMRVLRDEFGYSYPSIYLGDDQVIRLGAELGYRTPIPEFRRDRGVLGRVMRTRVAELIPDVTTDPAYLSAADEVRSEVCVPLLAGDRFVGVLNVESRFRLAADDLASLSIVADRFAAAISLAERREALQAVLDASPLAISATDQRGIVTYWNRAATELFGFAVDEVVSRLPPHVPGGDGPSELRRRVSQGERFDGVEGERLHRDGRLIPVRMFAAPFGDRAPFGAIVIHEDLSAERAASAALTESEARFETVVGALQEGVAVQDMAMNIVWSNEATQWLLGLTPDELAGTAPWPASWRVIHEDGSPLEAADLPGAVAARTGEPVLGETLGLHRPDGSFAWLETQAVPLRRVPDEPPYAVVTSFTDVTERKRHADELRRAERQVSAVLEQAPSPMIGVDTAGRITFANQRAGEVFGYEAGELVGRPIEMLVPEGLEEAHTRLREEYMEHPAPRPMGIGMELRARRRDGTTLPVEVAINPVETPDGREVYATVVDISERTRIEAELLQAAKMDSVGRLAGGIAHDFNNLLTAIIGYGQIATTEIPPTMSARADVEEMVKAAERAAGLTRQLLGFARKTVLAPASHDLNTILDGLEPFLRRLIGEPVALVTNLDRGIGHIRVDRAQVDQILVNLAVNARDAMPDGGTLVVETSSLGADDVDSVLGVRGDRIVMLSFSDTGVGMSEEVRLHAFEPFYTTKPFGEGTGLGLATTYGIVHQSGGAITIDSAPGAGTTFRIYFPEVLASEAPIPAAPRSVPAADARHTILVVEDEESVRTLVVRMLERAGFRVLQAPNGAAALSLVGTRLREIDLLLSDVVMPGMRGPELYEVLRTARPDLRAVFMSGYPAEDGARVRGAAPILAKPFSTEDLVAAIVDGLAADPDDAPAEG